MPTAIRALTFDYWDTLYDGATIAERLALRVDAMRALITALGLTPDDETMLAWYRASGREADRWWREEHRGYRTEERIRWMLRHAGYADEPDAALVARAAQAVDDALLVHPPPLLAGAAAAIRALAARVPLAIVSDTGFASARAQERLLARDGLRDCFRAEVYSADVGVAKPRPEMFSAAVGALGVAPEEIVHIGDSERTDVGGALASGLRAVRLDVVRGSGESAAEFVATSYEALIAFLR